MTTQPSRITTILQAVFVTILWASSWILIKFGLRNSIPAITFAGLRYGLAWLCLTPFILFKREQRSGLRRLSRADWMRLSALGLVFYTLTQGAQFVGLAYLPAAMFSLLLNLTPVIVGVAAIFLLRERPTSSQWVRHRTGNGGRGPLLPTDLAAPGTSHWRGNSPGGRSGQCRLFPARTRHQSQRNPVPVGSHFCQYGNWLLVTTGHRRSHTRLWLDDLAEIGRSSPGWRWLIRPLHLPCGTTPCARYPRSNRA